MTFRIRLVLGALLLVPAVASAQDVAYGVKGGITFATIAFDPEPGADSGMRAGLAVAGFATIRVGSRLAVQPEAFFTRKGTSLSDNGVDAKVHLDYLEVPVLLKYAIASSGARDIHVFGGPAVAFKLGAASEAEFGGEPVEVGLDETIEDLDLGIVFGADVQFRHVVVEGRYTLGLKNISVDPEDAKARNRAFTFVVGVRF